jgi:hypothetical protein
MADNGRYAAIVVSEVRILPLSANSTGVHKALPKKGEVSFRSVLKIL